MDEIRAVSTQCAQDLVIEKAQAMRGAIYSGVCEVLMAVLKEVKDKRCLDLPLEVKRLRELMAPNIEAIIDSW